MNGAPNGGAGTTGDESLAVPSSDDSSARDERIRLVRAAALGFALGLLLARWAAGPSS